MKYSLSTAALALCAGVASAIPLTISAVEENRVTALETRHGDACASRLSALGIQPGINSGSSGSGVWIGKDGAYKNTFRNKTPHDICLVVWGDQPQYQASFVGSTQPLITISLPKHGGHETLSFADGQSGAWAGLYPTTTLTEMGQIQNTWGEFTMTAMGVVDVSREVYMDGHPMSIKGPDCHANMHKCVYTCTNGASTCYEAGTYQLDNCTPGTQPGAQSDSTGTLGGCGWMGKTSVHLRTNFHPHPQ